MKDLVRHRKAHFDFEILDTYEAGIELLGFEAKALRTGKGKIEGAYVVVRGGEAYLVGASIPPHQPANAPASHDTERPRRLLLSKEEIHEISHKSEQKGLTIVPLVAYASNRNIKVRIAVVRGKKKYDKREHIKERDTKRAIARTLKNQ